MVKENNINTELKNLFTDPNLAGESKANFWKAKKYIDEIVSSAVDLYKELPEGLSLEEFAFLRSLGNTDLTEFKDRIEEFKKYKLNNPNANIKQYYDAKTLEEKIEFCIEDEDCIKKVQEKYEKGTILIDDYPQKGGRKNRRRTNKKRNARRKSFRRRR